MTTWIPEPFAQVGRVLKIRAQGGPWVDGWKVQVVFASRSDGAEVLERSRDYRHQREASDMKRGERGI